MTAVPGGSSILKTREYIFMSLKELPLIISAASLFLGIAEGNMNLLMLFVGEGIAAPLAAGIVGFILNFILGHIDSFFGLTGSNTGSYWTTRASDVGGLIGYSNSGPPLVSAVPTYWLVMVLFFFSYLFINALSLYQQPATEGADSDKVESRKSQAVISMGLILVVGLCVILAHFFLQGGETILGVIVAALVAVPLAYGWFKWLETCSLGRLEDLFGIRARLLPESAVDEAPVVCSSSGGGSDE